MSALDREHDVFNEISLMETINPILARKLGMAAASTSKVEAAAVSPERQVRRALGRAADQSLGLSATLEQVTQEELEAEDLIETGPEGWIVLGLRDGTTAGLSGLFLIDPPMRSALVEMQTMGSLLAPTDEQRRVTRVDAVMAVPFASLFLTELATVGFGGADVDPAAYDMGPIDDLRTAGLVMMQGRYRRWKIKIKMGAGDVVGEMMIAMRPPPVQVDVPSNTALNWSSALRSALNEAPADLDAVLTRFSHPINEVEAFEVGQVIKLAGVTVGSVTLNGPRGEVVASARLGQVAGKRAVRIEHAHVEMQDDPPQQAVVDAGVATMTAPNVPDTLGATPDLVEG